MNGKPEWLKIGKVISEAIQKIIDAGQDGKITIYEALDIVIFVIKELSLIKDKDKKVP